MTLHSIIQYVKKNFIFKRDSNLEYIIHSGGRGENGFITLIFYSDGYPVVVGKVPRDRRRELGIKNEHNALKTIRKILNNSDLIKTIETFFPLVSLDGNLILFKEYKNGIPGDKYILSNNWRKINKSRIFLRSSTEWLIKFLNETKKYHINSKEEKERAVYKLMRTENYGLDRNLPPYFKYCIEKEEFFLAPSHGDLVVSNILIKEHEVCGVIDFENFAFKGFPFADLIGIMVDTGILLYGTTQKMINKTFFDLNPFSQEACNSILKFCEVFELDIEDFIHVMPIYSDRAISICIDWDMKDLLEFHTNLKSNLIKRQNELILINYI